VNRIFLGQNQIHVHLIYLIFKVKTHFQFNFSRNIKKKIKKIRTQYSEISTVTCMYVIGLLKMRLTVNLSGNTKWSYFFV
jgi:hypothetical protein